MNISSLLNQFKTQITSNSYSTINDKQEANIFQTRENFKKFIKEKTTASEAEISINIEDIEDLIDLFNETLKESQQENIELTAKDGNLNLFSEILTILFNDEKIVEELDKNNDKKIDNDEIKEFLKAISTIDGNMEDLSLEDIYNSVESIYDKKSSEVEKNKKLPKTETPFILTKANTHDSNYSGPDGNLVSYTKEKELNTVNEKIKEANNQIIQKQNKKAEINAENVEYAKTIENLNKTTTKISQSNSLIAQYESELHTIEYDLVAIESQLNNLEDPQIFTEQQPEIDQLRASLKSQKTTLEKNKKEKETQLNQEKENLKTKLTPQKESLTAQIKEFEKNHPNSEIDKINQEIETLKNTIKQFENDREQIQKDLNSQRSSELKDAEIYGKAQAYRQSEFVKFMMDYATNPETKKFYDNWYFNHHQAYCDKFTSEISELLYAKVMEKLGLTKEDLTNLNTFGDKNDRIYSIQGTEMTNAAFKWGTKIQSALDYAGINKKATIDISKMSQEERKNAVRNGLIYPGMTFEYQKDGQYHTGFIESINKDLSWNTIEGNTGIKYEDGKSEVATVGSHRTDANRNGLIYVDDTTLKTYLLLLSVNKMSKTEINEKLYHI